ncbi:MAG TPA: GNAT family N-acetyltransferase [Chloroflexia bacterium]|nr:GNAT family N-acetyltransferase [Chloroflexia bacterium]
MRIERVKYEEADNVLAGLVDVLVDCVNRGSGTSISFHPPLAPERAEKFWRDKFADIANGKRILLVAREADRIAGTVMVEFMTTDNQPHRGEVQKLLVHGDFRRLGIASALMEAIEEAALDSDRTLLVLDTLKDSPAQTLYRQLGWQEVGEIPCFARSPEGIYESTVIFYKNLQK